MAQQELKCRAAPAVHAAAEMGLEKIHLFTPRSEKLYAGLAWELM